MKPQPKVKKQRFAKCKSCGGLFAKSNSAHRACSLGCAVKLAKLDRQKREQKAYREQKVKHRTRRDWLKLAQSAFNAYIRKRDAGKPCICCGQPLTADAVGGGFDCGHYRSVGSAPHLRFDPRNAHAQSKQHNRWGSGRAVDYRIGLIQRIGLAEVEALEADNSVKKWTIEELIEIRRTYTEKAKQL
jgi:hypothetical protein